MQQLRLTEVQRQVYAAVTGLEARGEPPYASRVQRETGLPAEQVHRTLHDLAEKNLVRREDTPQEGTDLGPRWCTRQPA